jgi:signal transduction histidine kinase
MRKSLSVKMLLLTFVSFLILLLFIVASIYIYFDKFYEPLKIRHMVSAINDFTASIEKNRWSEEELYSEVSAFMKRQNVTMSIDSGNEPPVLSRVGRIKNAKFQDFFVLADPKKVTLPGKLSTYDYIREHKISFLQYPILPAIPYIPAVVGYKGLGSGTAANINGTFVFYPDAEAAPAGKSLQYRTASRDGVAYTISNITNTNSRQIHFMKQSTLTDGKTIFTNVRASLQTVDEVMEFLRSFFPYLIAAAVLLSISLAVVYSKIISKPIVSITNTANRMANMELGITSDVNRRDELGALSLSLNTLSANLKTALDDLSQANEQLKKDYENELLQEKVRKEFVANVSHELKTPLGIIRSYSEGLRDGIKADKKEHYVQVILEEIVHMDKMIVEMLEISRFDAGSVGYHKEPGSFDLLLNKKVPLYADKAREKEVSIKLCGEFGGCLMDEEKIGRVLDNLLGNAVKYCDTNSIITIRGERTSDTLTVIIENDCPLYPEEVLEKLWDRFYKADTSHNRDIEGTGLGLAITKSILEGHSSSYGVIGIERGIRFYFTLEAYNTGAVSKHH